MTDILEHAVRELELGIKAKEFINSDLGGHIIDTAREECEELRAELEDFQTPLEKVPELRQKIFARTAALRWLFDTINQGEAAAKIVESPEE